MVLTSSVLVGSVSWIVLVAMGVASALMGRRSSVLDRLPQPDDTEARITALTQKVRAKANR